MKIARPAMKKLFIAIGAPILMIAAASVAHAQSADSTINRIKSTNKIKIGVRDFSIPFSYLDSNQKPIGYSIDLCMAVVDSLKKELNLPNLEVVTQSVDLSTRIPLVQNGTIDMECGSTVNTLARQKQVDFSYVTAVAADQLLVKANSPVKELEDLAGKVIALPNASTSMAMLLSANSKRNLNVRFLYVREQAEGLLAVQTGRADAYITDNTILYGLRKNSKNPEEFRITGRPLSYLPYGILVAKNNSTLMAIINRTIAEKFRNGEGKSLYEKWFGQLGMPLSPVTKAAFELNSIPD
ncbi:amino acid ABC transporter substrate-binding protein [Herbaspirillum chlorophenolicum]|jgi:glutamate/aspartate transport system substrate-binding protein|uniref:amino acid ABC transporter substrate-binding protein n=1 Tax=Herbaspirillum chlorophenolicum TaxID=211589 RepID=UPI00067D6A55|nr:amino acid ABC transporter substrate-binding protein [Herbaspirillum chlorophenolicum]